MVSVIHDNLAAGLPPEEIIESYHIGARKQYRQLLLMRQRWRSNGSVIPSNERIPFRPLYSNMKTNAVRLLERAGIAHELRQYYLGETQFSAVQVAAKLDMPSERVFKTLITHGDNTGHLFALIPAGTELNLRALAAASGNKRVEMAPLRDVLALTGYVRGAVTALATKRSYPVFIDESVELWPAVAISAGARGLQIVLAPQDLVRITDAQIADLTQSAAQACARPGGML